MKKAFFVVPIYFFFALSLNANEYTYNYKKIRSGLSSVLHLITYPPIEAEALVESSNLDPLPDWIQEASKKFQNAYFGQQVLSVVATSGCEACTDSVQNIIFINPKFVEWILSQKNLENPKAAFEFILAHEIGHFAYEVFIVLNGSSPNGFPSLQAGSPLNTGIKGHVEIDLFALMIYKKLRLNFPDEFLKLLKSSEDLPYSDETQLRVHTLENARSLF